MWVLPWHKAFVITYQGRKNNIDPISSSWQAQFFGSDRPGVYSTEGTTRKTEPQLEILLWSGKDFCTHLCFGLRVFFLVYLSHAFLCGMCVVLKRQQVTILSCHSQDKSLTKLFFSFCSEMVFTLSSSMMAAKHAGILIITV